MIVANFATARNAVEDGNVVYIHNFSLHGGDGYYGLAQAKITGTLTVKLQGRLTSSHDWVDLVTYTASGWGEIKILPEMRYSITNVAGGTLNALDVGFMRKI